MNDTLAPEETLVADPRGALRPAEAVELRLRMLLGGLTVLTDHQTSTIRNMTDQELRAAAVCAIRLAWRSRDKFNREWKDGVYAECDRRGRRDLWASALAVVDAENAANRSANARAAEESRSR